MMQMDLKQYEQSDLYRIRHTAAHILAQAVLEMYPEAKLGIGPPIEDGFYYDFDLGVGDDDRPRTFKPDDLVKLEKRMRQIIVGHHPVQYREISEDEGRRLFSDQPYKLELIHGLVAGREDEYGNRVRESMVLSTYRHDDFEDLCRGHHVRETGHVPMEGLKLMSTAAAGEVGWPSARAGRHDRYRANRHSQWDRR